MRPWGLFQDLFFCKRHRSLAIIVSAPTRIAAVALAAIATAIAMGTTAAATPTTAAADANDGVRASATVAAATVAPVAPAASAVFPIWNGFVLPVPLIIIN